MTKIKSSKIWITGAGSGIGKALALEFNKNSDVKFILSGRNIENLESTRQSLSNPDKVKLLALDLENHDELDRILEENTPLLSDVDILINNAGISQRSLAKDTRFEVYKRLMDINYLGTIKISLFLLQHFLKRNSGHFVVISSSAGKFGVPVRSGYSASKFALHGFFEALRAEVDKTKIEVTMVCPGFIKTDISKNALTADGSYQGTMDKAQANGMTPEVLAEKVLNAIESNKAEISVGGFKETKLAIWVSRIFPSLFRKVIANSEVT